MKLSDELAISVVAAEVEALVLNFPKEAFPAFIKFTRTRNMYIITRNVRRIINNAG